MGKRNTAKSGGASAVVRKQMEKKAAKSAPRPVESDAESEESENYMTFNKKSKDSDDEEEDEEVFNMALDKDDDDEESDGIESESEGDDSEEDDEEDSEENDEEDSDDDGEENETERELKELVSNLPAHLRQQVLKKEAAAKRRRAGEEVPESEDEDEEDSEEEEEEGWGRKKKTYWEGDTADLEIGQEMEDALDEEEAAQELHREKTKRMKASDFMEDFEGSDDDNSDSDDSSNSDDSNSIEDNKILNNEVTVGNLASISLGQDEIESDDDNDKIKVEKLTKNIEHLTKKQRLDMISKNSPELLGIVNELKDQIGDLKGRIIPVKEFILKISSNYTVNDDIVDYLEVKSQLLLSYCINVVYYLYIKSQGKSVSNHPVMKQLLKLRYVMEKMRPLDGKLKHQIDRLVQLSELSPSDLSEQKSTDLLRPNPMALLSSTDTITNTTNSTKKKGNNKNYNSDTSDDDEDSETGYSEQKESETGVYKVPKRVAVPYKQSETLLEKKEAKIEKQKAKIKRSELMDTLREEFGNAPEAAASSGLGIKSGELRKLQEEEDERRDFEEERFVRLTMSRKDKQSNKRRTAEASRLDNFDDIGDIGDFEEITKLAGGSTSDKLDHTTTAPISKKITAATGSALQRAVMALAGNNNDNEDELSHGNNKKSKMRAMAAAMAGDSDDEDPYAALLAAGPDNNNNDRKRRRAPMGNMNDSDDELMDRDYGNDGDNSDDDNNLLEDFSLKKKKYLAEKKSHYTAEPQYAGYEDTIQDGNKRAASYEIIKNKGLTPHRKKANRNPRVKKREMFDKAVIRRKGQVRDVISGAAGAYGGELTGIKSNLARSRKIGV